MDYNETPITSEKSKQGDPEYVLKGVQAFAVGVALFGGSFAILRLALQIGLSSPDWFYIALATFLTLIDIVISLFACIAVVLGLTMSGLWQPKKPVVAADWVITAFAAVLVFALVNRATLGGP